MTCKIGRNGRGKDREERFNLKPKEGKTKSSEDKEGKK